MISYRGVLPHRHRHQVNYETRLHTCTHSLSHIHLNTHHSHWDCHHRRTEDGRCSESHLHRFHGKWFHHLEEIDNHRDRRRRGKKRIWGFVDRGHRMYSLGQSLLCKSDTWDHILSIPIRSLWIECMLLVDTALQYTCFGQNAKVDCNSSTGN